MLNAKVKTGLIFAIVAIIFLFINSYNLFLTIFIIASLLAHGEACKIFNTNSNYLILIFGLILCVLTQMPIPSIVLATLILASLLAYKQGDLKQLLPFIYANLGLAFIFTIYISYELSGFILLLLSVVLCDSFAYFIGKKFGKTSFSPSSPNKTIEGVFGGIIVSTVFTSLYAMYYLNFSATQAFFVSFLMAAFAVFGDLFESYLKRLANLKDSSDLFPGHGGVCDRIDALIFASIVMVVFL